MLMCLFIAFLFILFIAFMFSIIYPSEIYQWYHYNIYEFKVWLKSGSRKKDVEEEALKRKVKTMNINDLVRLLNKYNIQYDIADIKKASFDIKIKYYKKVLDEKYRIKENKRIDDLLKQKVKQEKDDFDVEEFDRQVEEGLKARQRRNSKSK